MGVKLNPVSPGIRGGWRATVVYKGGVVGGRGTQWHSGVNTGRCSGVALVNGNTVRGAVRGTEGGGGHFFAVNGDLVGGTVNTTSALRSKLG